jgi:hypothetical protein
MCVGLARIGDGTESFESFPFPKVEQSIQFLTLKVIDNGAELEAKGAGYRHSGVKQEFSLPVEEVPWRLA